MQRLRLRVLVVKHRKLLLFWCLNLSKSKTLKLLRFSDVAGLMNRKFKWIFWNVFWGQSRNIDTEKWLKFAQKSKKSAKISLTRKILSSLEFLPVVCTNNGVDSKPHFMKLHIFSFFVSFWNQCCEIAFQFFLLSLQILILKRRHRKYIKVTDWTKNNTRNQQYAICLAWVMNSLMTIFQNDIINHLIYSITKILTKDFSLFFCCSISFKDYSYFSVINFIITHSGKWKATETGECTIFLFYISIIS